MDSLQSGGSRLFPDSENASNAHTKNTSWKKFGLGLFYRLPQNGVLSALCSDYYEIIESPKGIRSGHRYRLKTWTWAMAHEPNFVELQIVEFL